MKDVSVPYVVTVVLSPVAHLYRRVKRACDAVDYSLVLYVKVVLIASLHLLANYRPLCLSAALPAGRGNDQNGETQQRDCRFTPGNAPIIDHGLYLPAHL